MLHFSGSDRAFIEALMQDYDIDVISLTKGNAGSALLTATGFHELENTPLDISGDTVGAGDAYASIVAIGYLLNWGPERILQTATTLARRICTIKGAIPTETGFYDGLLDCARGAA